MDGYTFILCLIGIIAILLGFTLVVTSIRDVLVARARGPIKDKDIPFDKN